MARYRAKWKEYWLISTLPSLGLEIDNYPAIKRHLLSFGKQRLAQNGQQLPGGGKSRKKTPHKWFELQDTCAYHGEFERPKLLWGELAEAGTFAYSDTCIYPNDTMYMMVGEHLKYLCAVMNSSVVTWLIERISLTTVWGGIRWKKFVVKNIPIPRPERVTMQRISGEVTHLINLIASGKEDDAHELRVALDRQVCDLYGLTKKETISLLGDI